MIGKIESKNAPAAIGPYSQAVATSSLIFVSGQIPVNPLDGTMADTIELQTEQSLKNIRAILEEAGCTMSDVIKTTVLLQNMNDFAAMNNVYASFFDGIYPAIACYEVVKLPKNAMIEIEAVAVNNNRNAKSEGE